MDGRKRLQVDLESNILNYLEDLAHEYRKSLDDRRFGAGSVAARLLKSLAAHPELIEQLLSETQTLENVHNHGKEVAPPAKQQKARRS